MPAWSTRYTYTEDTRLLDAICWPLEAQTERLSGPAPAAEKIYECHLGLAGAGGGACCGFAEAAASLLPRVSRNGYTSVLLIGALECKDRPGRTRARCRATL